MISGGGSFATPLRRTGAEIGGRTLGVKRRADNGVSRGLDSTAVAVCMTVLPVWFRSGAAFDEALSGEHAVVPLQVASSGRAPGMRRHQSNLNTGRRL